MKNKISRLVGKIISIKFPKFIQKSINKIFIYILKIDLSEFNEVNSYTSLQNLFTRKFKLQRSYSKNKKDIISPTDSKITQYGTINNDIILQVKGLFYKASKFITEQADIEKRKKIKDGQFINFYLSPKDYHHFHAPCDFSIHKIIHVPGTLFPVKKSSLEKQKNLFIENERVILECITTQNKVFYFVAIGALNVGKINIFKEPKLKTNLPSKKLPLTYNYKTPIKIQKGEDIGCFEMGSSVVLLFEKESIKFKSILEKNLNIKFGDIFGTFIQKNQSI